LCSPLPPLRCLLENQLPHNHKRAQKLRLTFLRRHINCPTAASCSTTLRQRRPAPAGSPPPPRRGIHQDFARSLASRRACCCCCCCSVAPWRMPRIVADRDSTSRPMSRRSAGTSDWSCTIATCGERSPSTSGTDCARYFQPAAIVAGEERRFLAARAASRQRHAIHHLSLFARMARGSYRTNSSPASRVVS
jgi:hypothetical protein